MIGKTIGTYEIEGLLGEGAIGQVYVARDTVLGRRVAIKMLRPELSRDRNFVERFYNEAKSLGHLNHTNITTLYALQEAGEEAFMVMELVHGLTLDAVLARLRRLTLRDSLAVLAQAIPGLRYAHRRGVIHRDLKPANLMLTDEGVVKIMDFGIARVRGSEHLTRVGEFCGTFVYASPEQIRGEEVDERSDLYSLAIVLYRMLTGAPPFMADNEYALMTAHLETAPPPLLGRVPDLDAASEGALLRALAKRADDRFASVEEFARAVGAHAVRAESAEILQQLYARACREGDPEATRVVAGRPGRAEPETVAGRTGARPSPPASGGPRTPEAGRRPWRLVGAGALALSLLFGGGYFAIATGVVPNPLAVGEGGTAAGGAAGRPPKAAVPSPAPSEAAAQEAPSPAAPKTAVDAPPSPAPAKVASSEPPSAPAKVAASEPPPSPAPAKVASSEPPPAPAKVASSEPPAPPIVATSEPPAPAPPEVAASNPTPPAKAASEEPPPAPTVLAKNETPPPSPPPALGPQSPPGPPEPEGKPDLLGRVTGAHGLAELEVDKHWIKLYGIVDRARGRRRSQHIQALIRYLKPSHNHIVCYRKAPETYRCYSDGKDIAQLALRDRMVRLAPDAPAEYRSLLARRH